MGAMTIFSVSAYVLALGFVSAATAALASVGMMALPAFL
jgi:hypothetical protein